MSNAATTPTMASFTLAISIYASTQSIIEAWTSPEMLEMWLYNTVTNPDTQVLEGYSIEGSWKASTTEFKEKGLVTLLLVEKATWSIHWDYGTTDVEVKEIAGDNVLQIHVTLADQDSTNLESLKMRWHFYLCNLKSVLEGGLDLRNKNPELKHLINE
jgi:hypothetical protein